MFDYSKESYFLNPANQALTEKRDDQQAAAMVNREARYLKAQAEFNNYIKDCSDDVICHAEDNATETLNEKYGRTRATVLMQANRAEWFEYASDSAEFLKSF